MLKRFQIPKTILWVMNIMIVQFLLFTLFRLATFFAFRPSTLSFPDCLSAFLLGIQFDLRWISFLLLPIVLASIKPAWSPFYSSRMKKIWTWYLALIVFIVFFFFIADFVSFSYNETRLDAGAMNFVEDPGISLHMIWQTYPLIWITIGLVCAIISVRWALDKSHWRVIINTEGKAIQHRQAPFLVAALLLGIFAWGRISVHPLMWRDSFALKDSFKTYLALNPLQNFFATMRLRQPVYNENQARKSFTTMANLLQLSNKEVFNFKRSVAPRSGALESEPNIVLVLCESFSMYKSSMSGNPLNTTPFFDSLCRKGIFFQRCFSPHFSTARGLFATITGTPDVQMFKFSTRNPSAINQQTIINQLEGYSRHYFLGGDPQFNNFEGLLRNIRDLQIHTEKNIRAPNINVWGISDKDLFYAANETFKKEQQPFFAIVQTSNNHRPYTIPPTDTDFDRQLLEKDTLKKYGFESEQEFNSFRYADYCFRKFMEAATREKYFHNTIFVFVGDHGVAGDALQFYPRSWTEQRLTDEHVPLLFYAPYILEPALHTETVSQIDVLPTIAGLLAKPYENYTLGRDVLDPDKKNDLAFITNTSGKIGMVTNDFYFIKSLDFAEKELVPASFHPPQYTQTQLDSVATHLEQLTDAFYQTAQYLLVNNKQR
ncbi:LTA synthase family protein [Niabella terrae]